MLVSLSQGQSNKVTIHHLIVRDSIDDAVVSALNNKDQTQEALLAALRYRLDKLSQKNFSLNIEN